MKKMKETERVDDHIIASVILGVDITEVYSPERVNEVAKRQGLVLGSSLDLTNGEDFTKPAHRRAAKWKTNAADPYLIVDSPPCTLFSMLQELNVHNTMSKPG